MSVTDVSRNFADCVNRVRYQGASFILHKNGVPVAQIVPVVVPVEAAPKRDLEAGAHRTTPLPEQPAAECQAETKRKTGKPAPKAPAPEIW
jgi:antitoxin (DNA-binding transcriptional repressor) of toxin-antitoxin stability system